MKHKKIKASTHGVKSRVSLNGQMIRSRVYIDYDGQFIMAKDKRIKVKFDKILGYYITRGF